jgi:phasin family protein
MTTLVQTPALQSFLNAQTSLLAEMTNKLSESVRRSTEAHLHYTQHCIEDSLQASRQVLCATDPVEFSTAVIANIIPAAEHMRNYQQQMVGVLTGAQVDLSRTAEQHMPEASRTANAVAAEVVRRSTEATEKVATEQRNAIERMAQAAQQAGQQLQQATQEAGQHMRNATEQAGQQMQQGAQQVAEQMRTGAQQTQQGAQAAAGQVAATGRHAEQPRPRA